MGTNRHTDSARKNNDYSRSARFLVMATIVVAALSVFLWQLLAGGATPAFAGAGDATGPVTITGMAKVGKTLTADTSAVVDTDGITNVSYTYEWYSGGAVVDGETATTYRVLARDMGNSIYVVVTFQDDASNEEQLQSAAFGPVPTVQNNEVTGRIDVFPPNQAFEVHARVFAREDISDGDGLPGTDEYRWQWLRNGQPIDGAIDREIYVVTADDVGSRISLRLQFNDRLGFEEEFVNDPSDPVPNGPVIRATNGYNFDDNDATVETLTVDLSRLNYPGVPADRSYTYLWEHVGAEGDVTDTFSIPQTYGDGMGGQIDRGADHDSGATFTLTSGDDGKYIQVEVTINNASDNDRRWKRKFANRATPEITMRPPVEAPANVAANVRSGGGSVTLNWGLTSYGGARPTSFQYRYKPTVLLSGSPFTDDDWTTAGGAARTVTVEGGLINNAAYTFEVRSSNANAMSDPQMVEATYLHKTKACP